MQDVLVIRYFSEDYGKCNYTKHLELSHLLPFPHILSGIKRIYIYIVKFKGKLVLSF